MKGPGTISNDPDPCSSREAITSDELVVVSVTDEAWVKACPNIQAISQNAALAVRSHQSSLQQEELGEITIVLADDNAMRQLNHGYRGLDKATNVLSFTAMASKVPGLTGPLGDVVLGFETVHRESIEFRRRLEDHARHLVVHGCLHLLGHDHEAEADAEQMEALETEILANLGISDPYAEGPTDFLEVNSGGMP